MTSKLDNGWSRRSLPVRPENSICRKNMILLSFFFFVLINLLRIFLLYRAIQLAIVERVKDLFYLPLTLFI